jgi:hypothetical protein
MSPIELSRGDSEMIDRCYESHLSQIQQEKTKKSEQPHCPMTNNIQR